MYRRLASQARKFGTARIKEVVEKKKKEYLEKDYYNGELILRYFSGDESALEELLIKNKGLMWSIVNEFSFLDLEKEDLLQEARMGLVRAVLAFEWWKGFNFSSFAAKCMRNKIRYFATYSGRYPKGYLSRIGHIVNRLNKKGLKITPENISKVVNISITQAEELLDFKLLSLDKPLKEGEEDNTFYDILPSEQFNEDNEKDDEPDLKYSKNEIKEAISELDERTQYIINEHFGFNGGEQKTLEEIGEEFHLTRERIRQIKEKGLKELKRILEYNRGIGKFLREHGPVELDEDKTDISSPIPD